MKGSVASLLLLLSAFGIDNVSATEATVIANDQQEVDHSSLDEVGVVEGHSETPLARRRGVAARRRRRRTAEAPGPSNPLAARVEKLEKELAALRELFQEAHPLPRGSMTVSFKGYKYRTMMYGLTANGLAPGNTAFSTDVCHGKVWRPMPKGWEVAPDSDSVIKNVVSKNTFSASLVVLKMDQGTFQAYRTSAKQPEGCGPGALQRICLTPGEKFGSGAQARVRTVSAGVGDQRKDLAFEEYFCPWDCYQILIRKKDTSDVRRRRR